MYNVIKKSFSYFKKGRVIQTNKIIHAATKMVVLTISITVEPRNSKRFTESAKQAYLEKLAIVKSFVLIDVHH